jgi:hypothetical protein
MIFLALQLLGNHGRKGIQAFHSPAAAGCQTADHPEVAQAAVTRRLKPVKPAPSVF